MNFHFLRKSKTVFRILQDANGIHVLISILNDKYGLKIPQSSTSRWKGGISSEVAYWEDWFRRKGYQCGDTYQDRLDPNQPLQLHVSKVVPDSLTEVNILDVGAGPLTYLGKVMAGKQINITAVDPLARDYDQILKRHDIQPIVRTTELEAEKLTSKFPKNSFDVVFARNSLDHSHDPELAVSQIIEVLKEERVALLQHRINEAETQDYQGLHQWNFDSDSDANFILRSKSVTLNVSEKHADSCSIQCRKFDEGKHGKWLMVEIRKHRAT